MHLQNCYVSSVYSQNVQNVNGEICNDTSDLVVFEHVAYELLKIFFQMKFRRCWVFKKKSSARPSCRMGRF
jgi:hypothetical protein